jgi:hypothetical protein
MANDIDMWNDIEHYDGLGKRKIKTPNGLFSASELSSDLLKCFNVRYNEYLPDLAEQYKNDFYEKYGYWGKYYE